MELSATTPLYFNGTINAGGTLSNEIDLGDASYAGLIMTSTPVNGTITFQVAAFSDNHPTLGSTVRYVDLYDDAGAIVSATLPSAKCAISSLIMAKVCGYRYVKIKTTPAQTNGLSFIMPGRP